jgi:flagellar assembly protein FliH
MSSDQVQRVSPPNANPFLYPAPVGNSESGTPAAQWPDNHLTQSNGPNERQIRESGIAEGITRARGDHEKALADARNQIGNAIREFLKLREQYFASVEGEVVQLSLAIAKKIIHRESQLDPMLLAGVVRVALDKIVAGTLIRLKANPADLKLWQEYFAHAADIRPAPEVIGDPSLARGECSLETEIGSTHINFDLQLKEIEQGFLDLLQHREQVRA